jgi:hypothetical protein
MSEIELSDFLSGAYVGFTGSRGITSTPFVVSDTFTASDQDFILADTTEKSFVISMPPSPDVGNGVKIATVSSDINNLIIDGNNNTFKDSLSELVIDTDNLILDLIYTGTTWQVFENVGKDGEAGPVGFTGSQGEIGFTGSAAEATVDIENAIAMAIVFG